MSDIFTLSGPPEIGYMSRGILTGAPVIKVEFETTMKYGREGYRYQQSKLVELILEKGKITSSVCFTGGEPFDQLTGFFLEFLQTACIKTYGGYLNVFVETPGKTLPLPEVLRRVDGISVEVPISEAEIADPYTHWGILDFYMNLHDDWRVEDFKMSGAVEFYVEPESTDDLEHLDTAILRPYHAQNDCTWTAPPVVIKPKLAELYPVMKTALLEKIAQHPYWNRYGLRVLPREL